MKAGDVVLVDDAWAKVIMDEYRGADGEPCLRPHGEEKKEERQEGTEENQAALIQAELETFREAAAQKEAEFEAFRKEVAVSQAETVGEDIFKALDNDVIIAVAQLNGSEAKTMRGARKHLSQLSALEALTLVIAHISGSSA